jgi:hypothetical protein
MCFCILWLGVLIWVKNPYRLLIIFDDLLRYRDDLQAHVERLKAAFEAEGIEVPPAPTAPAGGVDVFRGGAGDAGGAPAASPFAQVLYK